MMLLNTSCVFAKWLSGRGGSKGQERKRMGGKEREVGGGERDNEREGRREIRDRREIGRERGTEGDKTQERKREGGRERKRGNEGGRYGTEERGREIKDRRKSEGWHQDVFIS